MSGPTRIPPSPNALPKAGYERQCGKEERYDPDSGLAARLEWNRSESSRIRTRDEVDIAEGECQGAELVSRMTQDTSR
jgi:hypothetical protein